MIVELVLLAPLLLFLVLFWPKLFGRPKGLPPGPTGWPFLGNITQMVKVGQIEEWQKIYGDTFTIFTGSRPTLLMHNIQTVKKVFGDERSAGRDQTFATNFNGDRGLVSSEGELWKEQRRFALTTLRDMGMGKTWLEDNIIAEAEDLCSQLKETKGRPTDPKTLVDHSVSNVICSMVFGKRFSHSDTKFTRLTKMLAESVVLSSRPDARAMQFFPWLRHIPGFYHNIFTRCENINKDLIGFLKQLIKEHKNDTLSDGPKDYIDAFLIEKEKRTAKKSTFDDAQLLASVMDLFGAGTETTSTTLLWCFVLMVEHPEILKKVQEEIDDTVGSDNVVRMDHKAQLPFTEATILEVQRFCNLVPLGVPHEVVETMEVDGYMVPPKTFLFANLASIHFDKRYWDRPDEFDPNHFLDEQGKVKKPDGFIPFAVGKRACPGESLAKMELYLFFSNIMRNFNLENAPAKQVSSQDSENGFIRSPRPYEICFLPR